MIRKLVLFSMLGALSFGAAIPRPAGELAFEVPGKGKDLLSKYRGKVVLLLYILTTCAHCQNTTKILPAIQRDLKPMGLQIVEVASTTRDTPETVAEFAKKYQTNFPVGLVDGAHLLQWSQLTAEMRPTAPVVFIIDRQGILQAQFMGADPIMEERFVEQNLRTKLMQYLSAGPEPAKAAGKKSSKKNKK